MSHFTEYVKGATITETPFGLVATVLEYGPVAYSPEWVRSHRAEIAREIAAICEQMGDGATGEDCAMAIRHAYDIPYSPPERK